MNNNEAYIPSDYEKCGECEFDHDYEYEQAFAWHTLNTPNLENKEISLEECLTDQGVSLEQFQKRRSAISLDRFS
jgi:hypothetical protein